MKITIERQGHSDVVLTIEYYTEMGGPDGTQAAVGQDYVAVVIDGREVREPGHGHGAVGRLVAAALDAERY